MCLVVIWCCISVASPPTVSAPGESPCNITVTAPDTSGYLSNRYPISTPQAIQCGTESDPWIVSVLPGQRINVTLLDFTAALDGKPAKPQRPADRKVKDIDQKDDVALGIHRHASCILSVAQKGKGLSLNKFGDLS